jgi:hypothetical protein
MSTGGCKMDVKRKVGLVGVTVVVALGVGHLLQGGFGSQPRRVVEAPRPVAITPLAAGLGSTSQSPATHEAAPAPEIPEAALLPLQATPAEPEPTEGPAWALSGDSRNCPVSLDLTAAPKAMIDVTLLAPCSPEERVVIRHGGLAITGKTSLTGALFVSIPGMEEESVVSVLMPDGKDISAEISLPDLPIYRRIAVQWMDKDTFQLHAFEDGAIYGGKGHISAANPGNKLAGIPSKSGFMAFLGDDSVALPMLAEVYTYPIDLGVPVELTIEVDVSEVTCNRELLGELLLSEGGTYGATDLTLATPECDAIGDVLVLNNLLPDLKLATAN